MQRILGVSDFSRSKRIDAWGSPSVPGANPTYEGNADQFAGKLVRIRLQRGVLKVLVGVFLGEDSESIRIAELYSYNRFHVKVVPKAQIATIQTLDLTTGNWPEE